MREVLSYSRRGSRFTPAQQQAWDSYADRWVIPDDAVDGLADGAGPDFLAAAFDRPAPLVLEIGSGIGEATAAIAARHPEWNVLALEVWRPGVATGLGLLAQAGATNVRYLSIDAVWSLQALIAPDSLKELWTFFPDPWHKKRHHKRRLVDAEFAALAASRLASGGRWRLATDWPAYAEQMREVLDAEPELIGGPVPRWDERPVTKFERRGIAEGRPIADFCYRRR